MFVSVRLHFWKETSVNAWQIIWEQSKCDLIIVQSSPSEYVLNMIMSTVTCDVWRVTCLHWSRNNIYLYWSTSTSTFLCPHDDYGNISSRTNWIINSALKLTKVGCVCTIIVNINKPKVQHTYNNYGLNNLPLIICISISFSFVHH